MSRGTSPRVTVEIVFLDAKDFIEESIESVFSQSYQDWELVFVDDGSTDGSSAIARGYADRNPHRVRYLEHLGHQNRGISASRNLGMRNARGEYVALLDADDVWLPNKLADQVALMDAHPDVAMVYGATTYWHSWERSADPVRADYQPPLGFTSGVPVKPPEMLVSLLLGGAAIPCTTSLLARKNALTDVGGFEETFTGMYEDQALYTKLFLRYPVLPVQAEWDLYRQHDLSICATTERAGLEREARGKFLEWVDTYLGQSTRVPRSVTRALATARWRHRHPRAAAASRRVRRLLRRGKG